MFPATGERNGPSPPSLLGGLDGDGRGCVVAGALEAMGGSGLGRCFLGGAGGDGFCNVHLFCLCHPPPLRLMCHP